MPPGTLVTHSTHSDARPPDRGHRQDPIAPRTRPAFVEGVIECLVVDGHANVHLRYEDAEVEPSPMLEEGSSVPHTVGTAERTVTTTTTLPTTRGGRPSRAPDRTAEVDPRSAKLPQATAPLAACRAGCRPLPVVDLPRDLGEATGEGCSAERGVKLSFDRRLDLRERPAHLFFPPGARGRSEPGRGG